MRDPNPQASFQRNATDAFRIAVVSLVVLACGTTALGWWIGRWWGLVGGGLLGVLILATGLFGAVFFYAMSQDGA